MYRYLRLPVPTGFYSFLLGDLTFRMSGKKKKQSRARPKPQASRRLVDGDVDLPASSAAAAPSPAGGDTVVPEKSRRERDVKRGRSEGSGEEASRQDPLGGALASG
jgi:hypothetical protein